MDIKIALTEELDNNQENNTTCIYKGQGLYAKCKDCTETDGENCKLFHPDKRKPAATYEERYRSYWIKKLKYCGRGIGKPNRSID